MRTKAEIADAAKKLVDEFSNLPKGVTAETTASAAYVFGLVGHVAQELAEMVRDLTEVAASDADHGEAGYLHAIAERVGFEVTRWRDLFQLSQNHIKWFSGTLSEAEGFLIGWERHAEADSNQSDVKIASSVEAAYRCAMCRDTGVLTGNNRPCSCMAGAQSAAITVLRADLEEAEEERDALKVEVRGARKEIARRDELLKVVLAARLKHGPCGRGGYGPCDPDCLKCAVEVYRKDL